MSQIKPAQITLNALREGQVMNELAQAIHDATCAVRDMGKAADVTLSISFQPIKGVAQGLADSPIGVVAEVNTKLPKPALPSTLFYIDESGNPTRQPNHPQPDLNLSIAKGA